MGENCKGELQEWCQKRGGAHPVYCIRQSENDLFQAVVEIAGIADEAIVGEPQRKKKDAEQSAARKMLGHLNIARTPRTNIDLMHAQAMLQQEALGTTGPVPQVVMGGPVHEIMKMESDSHGNVTNGINGINGSEMGMKRQLPLESGGAMQAYLPPVKSAKFDTVHHPKVEPAMVKSVVMIDGENLPTIVSEVPVDDTQQIFIYFSKNHALARNNYGENISHSISPSTRQDGCDIFMAMDVMYMPRRYPNLEKITIYSRDKFASAVVDNIEYFFPSVKAYHDAHIGK